MAKAYLQATLNEIRITDGMVSLRGPNASMAGLIANNAVLDAQNQVPRTMQQWRALLDAIRTDFRQDVVSLYSLFPPEMREWLGAVVSEAEAQAKNSAHKHMAA